MGHQRRFERAPGTSGLPRFQTYYCLAANVVQGHNQISRQVPADYETRYSLQWKV